jgi:hypothetical protein
MLSAGYVHLHERPSPSGKLRLSGVVDIVVVVLVVVAAH